MRALLTGLVALAACSGASPDARVDAAGTDSAPGGDGSSGSGALVRYIGHLTMTATVPFGGAPYCSYSVTMKNVVIDLSIDPAKNLQWMVIDDNMVEAIVGTCPNPALGSLPEAFEADGNLLPPQPSGGYVPSLAAVPNQSPVAEVAVTLTPATTTSYSSTIRWHRTDLASPFDWTVNTPSPVDVALVMCDVGAEYCLGGSQKGAMYTCTDGMHLTMSKACSAGCTPAPVPPAPHGNEHCN